MYYDTFGLAYRRPGGQSIGRGAAAVTVESKSIDYVTSTSVAVA